MVSVHSRPSSNRLAGSAISSASDDSATSVNRGIFRQSRVPRLRIRVIGRSAKPGVAGQMPSVRYRPRSRARRLPARRHEGNARRWQPPRQKPRHSSRSRCRVARTRPDGALLRPGRTELPRPRRLRRGRRDGHLRTRHQRRSAHADAADDRPRTDAPGRLRGGGDRRHRPLAAAPRSSATWPSDAERGRGLHIVEALSARWGWRPQGPGKAVFAILTREA